MLYDEPAFPFEYEGDGGQTIPHSGMYLRDYFAARSLVAIAGLWKGNIGDFDSESADRTARAAYRMADAMLKARHPLTPSVETLERDRSSETKRN